jgi:hypothetical protein
LESEVAAGLSANQSLVQQELSQITKNIANNATKATTDVVKQKLTKIGKTGLEFTGKNVAPYVAAGAVYNKTYDSLNPEADVNLEAALNVDISQVPEEIKQAALNIKFD